MYLSTSPSWDLSPSPRSTFFVFPTLRSPKAALVASRNRCSSISNELKVAESVVVLWEAVAVSSLVIGLKEQKYDDIWEVFHKTVFLYV